LGQFRVSKHPVAGDFLGRERNTVRRRLIQNGPADAPAQKGLDGLQGLVSSDRSATFVDCRDNIDNVTLADLMDGLVTPDLANLPA
jgi:hypothetical protein